MDGAYRAAEAGLAELRGLIPRTLLDGPGWDRFLARVEELPAAAAGDAFLGCEFRLTAEAPAADLFVVVRAGSPLARHFIRSGEAAEPGSAAAALARYLAEIGQADSALHDRIAGTMLEYDLVEPPAGRRPEPGVFLKLRLTGEPGPGGRPRSLPLADPAHPPPSGSTRFGPGGRPRSLPLAVLADAVGWSGDEELRRPVARVLAELPPGARVAHVGALPSRAPRAVRLVVQGLGRDELGGLLERLGRRGAVRPASGVLAALGDVLPRFRLALDVAAAGPLPRLGLELYHPGTWGEERDGWLLTGRSDWRPAVERLAERGWCLAAKAQGLLAWCALDKLYDRRGVFLFYRGLNHVKLTITDAEGPGDARVDAKAYAGMVWSRMRDRPDAER